MTEFPELQQALVTAAGRRRRAPRLARPLVVAVACAAIGVAVIAIAEQPNDERVAAPPIDPLDHYAVFQRPEIRADEPPSAVSGTPGLTIEQSRIVAISDPWRVYLVAGTLDSRRTLCVFAVIGDRARFGCDPAGSVHGYGFPPSEGEPGGVVAAVPDGIRETEITWRDQAPVHAPVRDNAVLAPVDRWPGGPGTITWAGGDVPLKSGPSAP